MNMTRHAGNNFFSFLIDQFLIPPSELVVEENKRLMTYLSVSVTLPSEKVISHFYSHFIMNLLSSVLQIHFQQAQQH